MKILVISLAGIGDTLFATPLIHELRLKFPDATIDALVLWAGSRDILQNNPHLNTVHQKNLIAASKFEALQYLWGLRPNRYDVSFNTHPQSRVHYRIVARTVGAKLRISHSYDHSGALDRLLVNRELPQDYTQHAVTNNLALLTFVGAKPSLPKPGYELFLAPEETQWAQEYLAAKKLTGRSLLALHVGSGGTKNLALRRWPVEHYVELIQRLNHERPDTSVLLMGGPEERAAHEEILRNVNPTLTLQPETKNIRQAAAILKRCQVFLSVDTALMHVAAAMQVPRQIVIETPTFNKTVEPFGQNFVLMPNPEMPGNTLEYYRYDGGGIRGSTEAITHAMASVSVEKVYQVVQNALAAASP